MPTSLQTTYLAAAFGNELRLSTIDKPVPFSSNVSVDIQAGQLTHREPRNSVGLNNDTLTFDINQLPEKLWDELNEMRRLNRGWDGDNAEPISPVAIQRAKMLLTRLLQEQKSLREPTILPTFDGSIQIEWHDTDRSLELGFTNEKWIALGVEITAGQSPRRHTLSIFKPEDYYLAGKCYAWFVRREARRAPWPSK